MNKREPTVRTAAANTTQGRFECTFVIPTKAGMQICMIACMGLCGACSLHPRNEPLALEVPLILTAADTGYAECWFAVPKGGAGFYLSDLIVSHPTRENTVSADYSFSTSDGKSFTGEQLVGVNYENPLCPVYDVPNDNITIYFKIKCSAPNDAIVLQGARVCIYQVDEMFQKEHGTSLKYRLDMSRGVPSERTGRDAHTGIRQGAKEPNRGQ